MSTTSPLLQVFFNLNALPEITVLAVDSTVSNTVEASGILLDFDSLVSSFPDLTVSSAGPVGSSTTSGSTQRSLIAPAQKKDVSTLQLSDYECW